MSCQLHPLAVLNISDHYSRTKARCKDAAEVAALRVMGCLIGNRRTDGAVEVFNSFEMITTADGSIHLDFLRAKEAHAKNVFFEHEVVGWYAAPANERSADYTAYLADYLKRPDIVTLVLDTNSASPNLPFAATSNAGPMQVQVVSTDAEKIGIDHIARVVPQGGSASQQLTAHLGGVHGAIGRLSVGIETICAYLEGVKSGAIAKDHAILRSVKGLCNRLPLQNSEESKELLMQNYNDMLLVTYLASLTKTANEANEVAEKFNTAYEKHRRNHSHRAF